MQTFLPYSDYAKSARCLDQKRLGKQRVECKQILLALGVEVGPHTAYLSRWRNHPAVKMWSGHEAELCLYSVAVCQEWLDRGYKDSLKGQFLVAYDRMCGAKVPHLARPSWLGQAEFHASHRSNLLRKDPTHYSRYGWKEPDDLPYVWPVT